MKTQTKGFCRSAADSRGFWLSTNQATKLFERFRTARFFFFGHLELQIPEWEDWTRQMYVVLLIIYLALTTALFSCVCLRGWFTFYHGKSPLNHHLGNMFFSTTLRKAKFWLARYTCSDSSFGNLVGALGDQRRKRWWLRRDGPMPRFESLEHVLTMGGSLYSVG